MARKQKIEWDEPRKAFMQALGANLRAKREEAGLTVQGMADKVGLSHPTISGIEHGKRDFLASYFDRFAEALNISVAELMPQESAHAAASDTPRPDT